MGFHEICWKFFEVALESATNEFDISVADLIFNS